MDPGLSAALFDDHLEPWIIMSKQFLSFIVFSAAAWNFLPRYVEAQIDVDVVSESIVRVRAYEKNQVVAEGAGFVVNKMGNILTNAHLVEKAERVTVLSLKTEAEVVPQQVFADREMNLALLHVRSLNLPPLNLSAKGAQIGRAVRTLRFGVMGSVWLAQGTIGAYQTIFEKKAGRPVGRLLQHNALISAKDFGMPLFNECGDVVAINMPNPASAPWPFREAKPGGAIYALSSKNIVAALANRKIAHKVVNAECLSALERAEGDKRAIADSLEAARAQADSARKAAEKAEEKEEAARREAERVKARAESTRKAAVESIQAAKAQAESLKTAKARADSTRKAAAESLLVAKSRADSLKTAKAWADSATAAAAGRMKGAERGTGELLKWGIPVGGALVLLTLLGWLLSSQRRKEQLRSAESRLKAAEQTAEAARKAAANAPKPAPFRCLLEGRDSSGRPFALTISALALGDSAGVTLGRSPANADFVIDHEEVSREHVRLRCTDATLYAEDLNTLNGTKVNGRLLNPQERAALQNEDRLELGPLVFSVRLVQE